MDRELERDPRPQTYSEFERSLDSSRVVVDGLVMPLSERDRQVRRDYAAIDGPQNTRESAVDTRLRREKPLGIDRIPTVEEAGTAAVVRERVATSFPAYSAEKLERERVAQPLGIDRDTATDEEIDAWLAEHGHPITDGNYVAQLRKVGLEYAEVEPIQVESQLVERSGDDLGDDEKWEVSQHGGQEQAARSEFTIVAMTPDGFDTGGTIRAANLDEATREAWAHIEGADSSGLPIASAKIEWEDPLEGPQVSYIYSREQGFELSRPQGISLSHEREAAANLSAAQTATTKYSELLDASEDGRVFVAHVPGQIEGTTEAELWLTRDGFEESTANGFLPISDEEAAQDWPVARGLEIAQQIARNEKQISELVAESNDPRSETDPVGLLQGEADARANLLGLREEQAALMAVPSFAQQADAAIAQFEAAVSQAHEKIERHLVEQIALGYGTKEYQPINLSQSYHGFSGEAAQAIHDEALYRAFGSIRAARNDGRVVDEGRAMTGAYSQSREAQELEANRMLQPVIDEARENGDLTKQSGHVVTVETRETVEAPTRDEAIQAAEVATVAGVLVAERQTIVWIAQNSDIDSAEALVAATNYLTGRTDGFEATRQALGGDANVALPKAIAAGELKLNTVAMEHQQAQTLGVSIQ